MWDFDRSLEQAITYHRAEDAHFLPASTWQGDRLLLVHPLPHYFYRSLVEGAPLTAESADDTQPNNPGSGNSELAHGILHPDYATYTQFEANAPQNGSYECFHDSSAVPLDSYDQVIVHATKNKKETLGYLAQACSWGRAGATITVLAHNDVGGKAYIKHLRRLVGDTLFASSKAHYRIASFRVDRALLQHELRAQWAAEAQLSKVENTELLSAPGMFSHKKLDKGSGLLLESLSDINLSGKGLDAGAGYGALSHHVLSQASDNEEALDVHLHLVETHYPSLAAARSNLNSLDTNQNCRFTWGDIRILADQEPASVDWILCNPPFHTDKRQTIDLGKQVIAACHKLLTPKGRLFLVVNGHLPYKDTIESLFGTREPVVNSRGFHVYHLRLPEPKK